MVRSIYIRNCARFLQMFHPRFHTLRTIFCFKIQGPNWYQYSFTFNSPDVVYIHHSQCRGQALPRLVEKTVTPRQPSRLADRWWWWQRWWLPLHGYSSSQPKHEAIQPVILKAGEIHWLYCLTDVTIHKLSKTSAETWITHFLQTFKALKMADHFPQTIKDLQRLYICPHCDLDNEDSEPISLHDNPPHDYIHHCTKSG